MVLEYISSELSSGFDFGETPTNRSIVSFSIKSLALLVPGIILGYIIDKYVKKLYDAKKLGDNILYYIILQTIISVLLMFVISNIDSYVEISHEFQNTFAGLFFVSLFFGMQSNYIYLLQQYLDKTIKI